jgi:hypothetical protein
MSQTTKPKKETYFTIVRPLPHNHAKPSFGLFASSGRDGAAAKAATSLYNEIFKKKNQKIFVLYMAKNAKKDREYPYLAIIKDVDKQVPVSSGTINIKIERKVYSLCRKKVHDDVKRILAGESKDIKGNTLPPSTQGVKDEIKKIMESHETGKPPIKKTTPRSVPKSMKSKKSSYTPFQN